MIYKFWKNWKVTILIGLGIFLAALFLRVYNLTLLPVFGDEAIYIRWSQVMGAEPGLRFLPQSDGKQPLFMWVLMFLVRRFSDPLLIGRATSVFYGMGTLLGIFALTYYLFKSKKAALIAAVFWAISPFAVFFDRMALVDSMLTMFGVWILFFASITARRLRLDTALLAGFALGGALLTKSPAIFFALMIPFTWIISKWPERLPKKFIGKAQVLHFLKLGGLSLVTLIVGLVLYNILRLGENFHLIASRNQDYVFPISHVLTNPLSPFLSNISQMFEWIWILGPFVIVIFIILSLLSYLSLDHLKLKRRPKSEVALLFLWSLFPLVISSVYASTLTARYILFVLPSIYIFASLIFIDLTKRSNIIKKALYLGLFIYIVLALRANYLMLTKPDNAILPRVMRSGYLEEWTSGTGIVETAEFIRQEYLANPSEKIVVGTEGYFGTLPDALQAYLNPIPEITVIGVGLDLGEVPTSLVESKAFGNKTYLVINSTRLKAEPESIGLELIAVYPKAFRPDGSRETLYLFSVTEKAVKLTQ